ncbi:hypothetical protein [Chondromyces crocatus]|uniref:Uncharacterized protein n=1 Tax=Chondromyces crocatus TaxID=52 RepID=A0A0K1ETW0_CHOCO|nr:hypothetical protein [Chondromyces crocatus]AKT44072.1 uncharacterized protein CMC5_083100 [Chondromyces crocatus]
MSALLKKGWFVWAAGALLFFLSWVAFTIASHPRGLFSTWSHTSARFARVVLPVYREVESFAVAHLGMVIHWLWIALLAVLYVLLMLFTRGTRSERSPRPGRPSGSESDVGWLWRVRP